MTRRCSRCRLEKPTTEFYRRAGGATGHRSECKDCFKVKPEHRARRNELARQRYLQSPEKGREKDRANYRKFRVWLDAQKKRPCADCGRRYPPCAMDFDHRDRSRKLFSVGSAHGYPREVVMAEIAKCDLVCANCHRVRTFLRQEEDGLPPKVAIRGTVQLRFTFVG